MNYTYRYFIEGCNLGGSTNGVGNGTYILTLNNTSCCPLQYSTNYTWYVNVTDSHGVWANETFIFTTEELSTGIISYKTWILPVAVIFSIGFFMAMKTKTKKKRRREL
jgi:predicted secreted protein